MSLFFDIAAAFNPQRLEWETRMFEADQDAQRIEYDYNTYRE